MSHLHRQLAAQLAIAADKASCHPCTPVLPPAPAVARVAKPKAKGKRRGRKA